MKRTWGKFHYLSAASAWSSNERPWMHFIHVKPKDRQKPQVKKFFLFSKKKKKQENRFEN